MVKVSSPCLSAVYIHPSFVASSSRGVLRYRPETAPSESPTIRSAGFPPTPQRPTTMKRTIGIPCKGAPRSIVQEQGASGESTPLQ